MIQSQTALITGASSGIGKELAKIHAAKGGNLIIVARREQELQALKEVLEHQHQIHVTVIIQDLSQPGSAQELYTEIQKKQLQVDILINNAGFGKVGPFHQQNPEIIRQIMHLNMSTLTELSHLLLPGMIARKSGRILNIASVVSFFPGPLQAVYFASKAYVLSFSQAISGEVQGTGVTVTALCPGATKTGYAAEAGFSKEKAKNFGMNANVVAYCGYQAMMSGKTIAVPGLINKLMVFLTRLTPRSVATSLSKRFNGSSS